MENPSDNSSSEKNETSIPKYTFRFIATYLLSNGIILFFIPQLYNFDHWGYAVLISILLLFTLLNVIAGIQIYRKKSQGLLLGIIGIIPFCFGISVKAFSYKLLTVLNLTMTLEYLESGNFRWGFDFSFIANRINAYLNVSEIGVTINFVAIAVLTYLIEAYLKQRKTGKFPEKGY